MPFDEEELDPHGECAAEIKRLRAALREIEQFYVFIDTMIPPDKGSGVRVAMDNVRSALSANRIRPELENADAKITALKMALREVITNGEWTGGGDEVGEWKISKEVYETARDALGE